ncbi:stage II sporulation protein E [Cohnella pontilimi]|uniref:Stage II sporulation protein E n=1 Tax=Cohnella pontilimi TaxID=2564100 RepID=A0A4U0F240_9BACL|nr:stage II sporulation protein E [Cohnella pontilimi]TJY38555.1 stage II sporulation protein E [Cohnella pontilimi]
MDKSSVVPFVPRHGSYHPGSSSSPARKRWFVRSRKVKASGTSPQRLARWGQAFRQKQWVLLTVLMGFLLGRAELLEHLAPFAAAFFGVIMYIRRDMAFWAAAALISGSFWAADPAPAVIAGEIGVLYLLVRGLELYEKADLSHAPVVVFASSLLVRMFETVLEDNPDWLPYVWTAVEAAMAFVLTMLFVHALPVLNRTKKTVQLRHEEWIGVLILAACLITGLAGWTVYGVETSAVFTRYVVLLAAFVGGVSLGTSAGVVAGIMLSLSDLGAMGEIGLLAFGGLMAGLMREGGKAGSMLGLLLGTSVLGMYAPDSGAMLASTWATLAAAAFFFLTPRKATDAISKYVPGTPHYAQNQREYAKKVRDLTAERVSRFSEVFRQLSGSFRQMTQAGNPDQGSRDFDHFVGAVHEKACAGCHKRGACWDAQFFQTYKLMTDMLSAVEKEPDMLPSQIPKPWTRICVKTPLVLDILKREYDLYRHDLHWRRQLQDSRYLVADQLSGVSQVMDDLVREIRREAQQMERQEEEIRDAIDRLGLAVQSIDIMSLEEGRVEIEMVHAFKAGYDECRKMIAPLLSEILGETVCVRQERGGDPAVHLTTVTFSSAKAFEVETGVAGAAKDGDLMSGDSFTMTELYNGKFAVAISDGMGNGVRARMESSAALTMLEQMLQSGIDERLAVKSVNSILLLRSPDEMFATVDLALIDLFSAHATMLKIGSTPSFIKRGREIIPIAANNLPIGILQEIEIDLLRVQLQPGDTLIMMTDGVLDAPGHAMNKEMWMKRVLQEIETDDPQELADELLSIALRQNPTGGIRDDMTVVVTRVIRYQPEWAAFRFPGMGRVERPRTVS